MKKPDETASLNNRSLALMVTFGLSRSGWELSLRDGSHSCFIGRLENKYEIYESSGKLVEVLLIQKDGLMD